MVKNEQTPPIDDAIPQTTIDQLKTEGRSVLRCVDCGKLALHSEPFGTYVNEFEGPIAIDCEGVELVCPRHEDDDDHLLQPLPNDAPDQYARYYRHRLALRLMDDLDDMHLQAASAVTYSPYFSTYDWLEDFRQKTHIVGIKPPASTSVAAIAGDDQ